MGNTVVTEPYLYTLVENGKERQFLMTSISSAIIVAGKFLGVALIDMSMDTFKEQVSKTTPYGTGFAHLLSSTGIIMATRDPANIHKNM